MSAAIEPFDLFVSNDNLIELSGLRNNTAATGVYINDAAVSITLKDSAGVEVAGETWPLSMGYVTASDGIYRAVIENTITITAGLVYAAEVSADGDGLQAFWALTVIAATRTN